MSGTLDAILLVADRTERVDVFLAEETEYTRSRIQAWIKDGAATVNNETIKPNHVLKCGDVVRLCPPEKRACRMEPEDIPIEIVFEDADICIVNKPQGMVVHPAPGHENGTLVNALLFRLSDLSGVGGEARPGIVHRIDRMTSGLLVVAKNDNAHENLAEQFRTHEAGRSYLALAVGNFKEDEGTVIANIGRHPVDRKKMAVVPGGRTAVTHWRVLIRFGSYTLLSLKLETGRTHQIRVHMASIGHPLAGDTVYGSQRPQLGLIGQALHGYALHLVHPSSGEAMDFTAAIPDYFLQALKKLGWDGEKDEIERNALR